LILFAVLGGFGTSLYYLLRRSKLQRIDAELESAAHVLAANMRRPPWRQPRGPRDGFFDPGARRPGDRGPSKEYPPPLPGEERDLDGDGFREDPSGRWFGRGSPDGQFPTGLGGPAEEAMPEVFLRHFKGRPGADPYFVIWNADGRIREELNNPPGLTSPGTAGEDEVLRRQWGPYREVYLRGMRGSTILVGKSIEQDLAELHQQFGILLGTGVIVLATGLAGGWLLVRRALRPLQAISSAAESISASSLSRRIDVASTQSELGRLAQVLNTTFERLEQAFAQQVRFTADASHELRTPVAVILAQTDMARRKERTPEEYREVVEACYSAAERMKVLVDGLLTLTRSDSGRLDLDVQEFHLEEVVEECAELLRPMARERGVTVELDSRPLAVEGAPEQICQVITNLLANAIQYNRPGGNARVKLEEEGTEAVVTFSDSGVGISKEHIPRIFDRFYRVDPARSSRSTGIGLGLAITKAIVDAHRGTISCESVPGVGTTFTVRLPKRSRVGTGPPGPSGQAPACGPDSLGS
jgi:heavy metal sensor kinase